MRNMRRFNNWVLRNNNIFYPAGFGFALLLVGCVFDFGLACTVGTLIIGYAIGAYVNK